VDVQHEGHVVVSERGRRRRRRPGWVAPTAWRVASGLATRSRSASPNAARSRSVQQNSAN